MPRRAFLFYGAFFICMREDMNGMLFCNNKTLRKS